MRGNVTYERERMMDRRDNWVVGCREHERKIYRTKIPQCHITRTRAATPAVIYRPMSEVVNINLPRMSGRTIAGAVRFP